MTVRPLPNLTIEADDEVECLADAVLARWDASIEAKDDATSISIMDRIGAGIFDEGVTAKRVGAALRAIGDRPVTVNINSPGGDYHEGVAIYNLLAAHEQKVNVRVLGIAASAASMIAMAGDDVQIGEGASIMVHNTHTVAMGNADALMKRIAAMRQLDKALAEVYAARAGVDVTVAHAWMDDETYFTGGEAVEAGLANGLLPLPPKKGERPRAQTLRRVEQALALQGIPRKDRRAMLAEITGTPSAADIAATPSADSKAVGAALRALKTTISNMRGWIVDEEVIKAVNDIQAAFEAFKAENDFFLPDKFKNLAQASAYSRFDIFTRISVFVPLSAACRIPCR